MSPSGGQAKRGSAMRLAVMAGGLALLGTQAYAAPKWIGSWGASPAPPVVAPQGADPRRASPSFSNQTVVQVVRLSADGARLRVRFTNEYGSKALSLGSARVALVDAKG